MDARIIYEKLKHIYTAIQNYYDGLNKTLLKAKIGAGLSGIFLAVSIFVWGSMDGGVAWFSESKEVTAGGIQVKVADIDIIEAQITVHRILAKDDTTLYFDQTASTDTNLSTFDILDEVDRHVLLKIQLPNEYQNVRLTAETLTDYIMDADHLLLGTADGRGDTYNNCITSIVNLTNVAAAASTYDGKNAFSVSMPENPQGFLVDNEDGTRGIQQTIPLIENGTYSQIYILISYNEDMINRIYADNI